MKSDAGTCYQYEHELPHRSFLAPVFQLMALFRKAVETAGGRAYLEQRGPLGVGSRGTLIPGSFLSCSVSPHHQE